MDLQEKCKRLVVDYYNKRVDATDKKKITWMRTKSGKMYLYQIRRLNNYD